MKLNLTVFVMVMLMIIGCGKKQGEIVLMSVNGRSLTVEEVKSMVLVNAKIAELSGQPIPQGEFVVWANRKSGELVQPMVNARLIEEESLRVGVVPNAQDRSKVLAQMNGLTKRNAKDERELAAAFGEEGRAFLDHFEQMVRIAAYEREYWTPRVTDEMVAQHYHVISNLMRRTETVDAVAWKNARRAYARLKAGEKWADVALVSEDPKIEGRDLTKEWASTGPDALRIEGLAKQLPLMKPGSYTMPMDVGDGLAIVRLNGRKGSNYILSRILFRLAEKVKSPEKDPEAMRRRLASGLMNRRQEETLRRLRKTAKFDYPNGTNFSYRIWSVGKKEGK